MTRWQIGGFVLDAAAGELRNGSERIDMRPKLFTLLSYLVENHGRLVSKEELLDAIWPDVHVSEGSLNRTVAELRDILGDDADAPRFIETVPRRGYRFIAEVRNASDAAPRMSQFVLVHLNRTIPLHDGENVIGRTPDCNVQIVATSVSRRHARLVIAGDQVTLEDLGSTNGTFAGDVRVESPISVKGGDEIRIGREVLRLVDAALLHVSTEKVV